MRKIKNIVFQAPHELDNYLQYTVKVVDLQSHIEVRSYREIMLKKRPDRELKTVKKTSIKRCSKNEFRVDSLIRSWQNLKYYALANQFEWRSFITLTFADNISNLDVANAKFNDYTTRVRKKFKNFMYVGVIEFQDREAVHYHLITNIPPGSSLMPLMPLKRLWKPKENRYIDLKYYDLPHWIKGYSSGFGFDSVDDKFSIIGYLAKYFYKNIKNIKQAIKEGRLGEIDLRLYGRIKVLRSRNLMKPEIMYLNDLHNEDFQLLNDVKQYLKLHTSQVDSVSPYVPAVEYTLYQKVIDT
jgi:hypothetical protein